MLLSKLVRPFNEWKLHPSHIIETGFTFRHAVTKANAKHVRKYWYRSRASFYVDQYELLLDAEFIFCSLHDSIRLGSFLSFKAVCNNTC